MRNPALTKNWLSRLRPQPTALLIGLWVLTMLSLPFVRWNLGDEALHLGITAGVLTQVLAVMSVLVRAWGWRKTLGLAGGLIVLAWLAEWLGSRTDFPFGAYHYTGRLQPQLLGVPLLIPLAWLMMLPPAWAVAQACLRGCPGAETRRGRLAYIGLSAVVFTAWDLFLDPQMVGWGLWEWEHPGGYFGIPWVNFLGWLLVSALITALLGRAELPLRPLVAVYTITWLLQSIGQAFLWGQPGPALVGFVVMGLFVAWAWGKLARLVKICTVSEPS